MKNKINILLVLLLFSCTKDRLHCYECESWLNSESIGDTTLCMTPDELDRYRAENIYKWVRISKEDNSVVSIELTTECEIID